MSRGRWKRASLRTSVALVATLCLLFVPDLRADRAPSPVTISIVGTNDLHGRLAALPLLAGYLDNLRQARQRDGGGVVLVDAGDFAQGTIASNLDEGHTAIRAYNALGYSAMAIGNHDFDFGPVGERDANAIGQDPRGALRARSNEARFPFLGANLVRSDGTPERWPNLLASTLIEVAGVPVGIIGAADENLVKVIRPSDFAGLAFVDAGRSIRAEAIRLREEGAQVVIAVVHGGGECRVFDDPHDLSSCDLSGAIFGIARSFEPGLIDVLVAGHQHERIAHRVNGIAVIESGSKGRAFGRVDLVLQSGRLTGAVIHPPTDLCAEPGPFESCRVEDYEGRRVGRRSAMATLIAEADAAARQLTDQSLGVLVRLPLLRSQTAESALGNLAVDLMRESFSDSVDVAIQNGGALRADIPAGDLTFSKLYRGISLENFFAVVTAPVGELERDLARSFASGEDVVSISGARIVARCVSGELLVDLRDSTGAAFPDDRLLRVLTNDYLASGGDDLFRVEDPRYGVEIDYRHPMVTETIAARLRERGGELRGDDPRFFDPGNRRVVLPSSPPISCD